MGLLPVNYLKSGGGEAIVLLHGFLQDARAWHDITSRLAQNYLTVAIDIRGHGSTGMAAGEPTPETVASDIAVVLDVEGIDQAALWGYSMGGRIALNTALSYPARFSALIVEGAHAGIEDAPARERRRADDEKIAGFVERSPIELFVDRWEKLPIFSSQSPELVARQRAVRLSQNPEGLAAALRGIGQASYEPIWARLSELTMPSLLLVGERDHRYVRAARRMAELVPSSELQLVRDAGHAAHLERPDLVAELVGNFLARVARAEG